MGGDGCQVADLQSFDDGGDPSAALLSLVLETDPLDGSTEELLAVVCGATGWEYGEAWFPDEGAGALRRRRTYASDDRFAAFTAASAEWTFQPNDGLVGRVWATANGEWVADATREDSDRFLRHELAREAGVHTAIAVPIVVEGRVLAVLALFSTDRREHDGNLLETIAALATYVGAGLVHERLVRTVLEERDLLARVLDSIPVAVMVVDREAGIERVNERLVDLMGVDADGLRNLDYRDPLWDLRDPTGAPLPEPDRPIRKAFATGDPQLDRRADVRLPSGKRIDAAINTAPIRGRDGTVRKVVVAVEDRTDEHEAWDRLQEKTRQLESFASVLSHDLRNPLGVVKGYLELARETGDLTYLESAERGTDRMEALINDLLLLARRGRAIGARTTVDLAATARAAWATVDTADATLEVGEGLGSILADESRLVQAFENLFRNAIEHAGATCHVRVVPLAEGAGFAVEDDGPGIPADRRADVVELADHRDGTARLGLAIVAAIAEGHGWELAITDAATGGARIEFHVL